MESAWHQSLFCPMETLEVTPPSPSHQKLVEEEWNTQGILGEEIRKEEISKVLVLEGRSEDIIIIRCRVERFHPAIHTITVDDIELRVEEERDHLFLGPVQTTRVGKQLNKVEVTFNQMPIIAAIQDTGSNTKMVVLDLTHSLRTDVIIVEMQLKYQEVN